MRNKEKIAHGAHIKRFTEGTSNEISFSVLDAAKNALDEGDGASTRPKHIALGSGTPWETPLDEVARRKKNRFRGKLIVGSVVTVIFISLLVAVGTLIHGFFQTNEARLGELSKAIDLLEKADTSIIHLDDLVTSNVDKTLSASEVETLQIKFNDLEETLNEAVGELDQAEGTVQLVKDNLTFDNDKSVAAAIQKAIAARQQMIADGKAILEEVIASEDAVVLTQDAWKYIGEGDAFVREAAGLVSQTTLENAHLSMEQSEAALSAFQTSRDEFDLAQDRYPVIDFSPYISYLDKRIEAQYFAIGSDQAYLDRDKTMAASQNDAYNQADAEAVILAAEIPGEPARLIRNYASSIIAHTMDSYTASRLSASNADSVIREYLGGF